MAQEFNFDGLVGPTHNYAGLSCGNLASQSHQNAVSSPKAAALQGLQKMKFVRDLGIPQCVLPSLPRPDLNFLRSIGFAGDDQNVIESAFCVDPAWVATAYSASNMWTANAATVSPGCDSSDGRLHLTPANLSSNLHRSIESNQTAAVLQKVFASNEHFQIHDPLIGSGAMSDEGAANHTRLCRSFGGPGIEMFVYGVEYLNRKSSRPKKYPARQTLESCQAIARNHQLNPDHCCFIQQNPAAIDSGVFHNDVIAVGHQNVLLIHEYAFVDQENVIALLQKKFSQVCQSDLAVVTINQAELPLADAVKSYLFNSQIVTKPNGHLALIAPQDCQENECAFACIQKIIESDNPIEDVHFLDLRQSMNNGGGPACLRLRVVMDEQQSAAMLPSVILTDKLHAGLIGWVNGHYRDSLSTDDLRDPQLITEVQKAMAELSDLLGIPLG